MNKKLNERILETYKNNVLKTLNELRKDETCPKNAEYFFSLAEDYFLKNKTEDNLPKIGLIGTCIPEEIIYALGAQPIWILGGSFGAGLAADEYVPRDTDPIVRSTIGIIKSGLVPSIQDCEAIIAPVAYDGERKMVSILSKEMEVWPVEIPPIKDITSSSLKWLEQIDKIKILLEKKIGKKINEQNLMVAVKLVQLAKLQIKELMEIKKKVFQSISGSLMLFIMNTYYFNNDLRRWIDEMKIFNKELNNRMKNHMENDIKPKVLIIGSPIYFPNMKIPKLLEELGAEVAAFEMEGQFLYSNEINPYDSSLKGIIYHIALKHYLYDYSPYFIQNEDRMSLLKNIARTRKVKGIFYHVLKGHLSYDFELEDIERAFGKEGIPVFRIETDYNYEDVEQLRIRIEAVIEMLSTKEIND